MTNTNAQALAGKTLPEWVAKWAATATDEGANEALREAAYKAGDVTYRATKLATCYECDGRVIQDGVYATGLPLTYHTPYPHELVKNRYFLCLDCGADQAS